MEEQQQQSQHKKPTAKSWFKFIFWTVLYLLFLFWLGSWWAVIFVPFIFDAYITKKIPWGWWRNSKNKTTRQIMSWVDAILFALVAVYFVNLYFFQNYVIPSSSLEKSLLTGDYLFVSKMSYGPRIPNTPLHMPLTSHTIPVLNTKSFIAWPQWDYRRIKGFGTVKQNDIVVFNYPGGDSVVTKIQDQDYYTMCYELGQQLYPCNLEGLSQQAQAETFRTLYNVGRNYILQNPDKFGKLIARPVDMRENYVKRCVGLPGQWLKIKNGLIYTDGKLNKQPDNVQYSYIVTLKYDIPEDFCKEYGITMEDRSETVSENEFNVRRMPLTARAYNALKKRTDMVTSITPSPSTDGLMLYPHNKVTGWNSNNYGPIWIPKKGKTMKLNLASLPLYLRPIQIYEHNKVEVRNGKIYINDKVANSYTFKMDYYWMMGDNRDNSADSRFWGFVPEDHIIGKPIMIWLSLNKDYGWFDGKIRWSRLFRFVDNIK